MSWAYEKIGTPEALIKDMTSYFDKTAETYKGRPEADDVTACKERILALLAACELDAVTNAVSVKASGSHSTNNKGRIYSANFSVQITRVSIAL